MNIPNGLQPLKKEDREANKPYTVGALFSVKEEIPETYRNLTSPLEVFNQAIAEGANDECAGCSAATVSEAQEGVPLDPHFHWMLARQRAGMKEEDFGCNIRDIAMTLVKAGSLEKEQSPFTFDRGRNFLQNPANWDIAGLLKKSVLHKKGSVVWVKPENGMDAYDVYRSSVVKFDALYKKPHGAILGIVWGYGFEEYLREVVENGSGHAIAVIGGWDGDYALMQNSYGKEVGKDGIQRIHRSIINKWAEVYGMAIPIDATQDEIRWAVENGVKLDGNWLLNIVIALLNFAKDLLEQLKQKTMGIFTKRVGSAMLWDTPAHIRFNVRTICDELYSYYKVPYWKRWFMKAEICACIKQESNWSSKDGKTVVPIIGKPNSNGTRDWGLCQYNDGKYKGKPLWIGEGALFKDTDEALYNMEKGVREMIKQQIAGNLWYWSSYKFGDYKKHLTSESRPGTPY